MTTKQRSAINQHLSELATIAESLRETAIQLHKGEINQHHAANRLNKIADQIGKQE